MELEQLERRWQLLDQKLDRTITMHSSLLRRAHLQAARRHVNRLAVWPMIDLVFAAVVVLASGSCLGDYWSSATLAIPTGALMMAGIFFLISNIRQLGDVFGITWDGPIGDIQLAMNRVRLARIRQLKWIILLGPLLWLCMMAVGGELLVGKRMLNVIASFDRAWLIGNIAFGILFIPVGMLFARMLSQSWQGSSFWKNLVDDVSGRSLVAARLELDRWSDVTNEQPIDGRRSVAQ
jgi:hypothetical protein